MRITSALIAVNLLALPPAAQATGQGAGQGAGYVLGDSIGEGVAIASGLKKLAHISVHIRGPRALEQIAQTPPGSTVFIVLGTNDADGGNIHLEKSIDDIVQAAERKNLTMYWLGPHCVRKSWDAKSRELDELLRAHLATTAVKYISMRDQRICTGTFLEPDGVHLTMKGYRYMWEKARTAVGYTGGTAIAMVKGSDGSAETTGAVSPPAAADAERRADTRVMPGRLVLEIHTPPAAPSAPLVWSRARN
jgi:lysophospholipase L1-like esterase